MVMTKAVWESRALKVDELVTVANTFTYTARSVGQATGPGPQVK